MLKDAMMQSRSILGKSFGWPRNEELKPSYELEDKVQENFFSTNALDINQPEVQQKFKEEAAVCTITTGAENHKVVEISAIVPSQKNLARKNVRARINTNLKEENYNQTKT